MSDVDSDDLLGPYLHWSFMGSVILLPSIQLNTFSGFLLGSLLTIAVCVSERCVRFRTNAVVAEEMRGVLTTLHVYMTGCSHC